MKQFKKLLSVSVIPILIVISFFNNDIPNNTTDKKILYIFNGVEKQWTLDEARDSINWSNVKKVTVIPDTVAIKRYGEKGKNGATLIQFKNK